MYLPDINEHCPYCGAKVIRPAFSAKKGGTCRICGRHFSIAACRLGAEKTKPFFCSKGEAALAAVGIVILILFVVFAGAGYNTMFG